ncbi:hypothetical protein ERX46_05330 [Brumimicrobium glaciale]|uniref:Uncharacterized protein n=1 Tax=Brumimicrobium glaciale TaxID=200475 RepID=A0A4Q4KPL7_9FLAO|nr:hypothetical protein [Brumimicrobium glaciale]RYM34797.1 hypothetical protein ERX46_05330 [Brumimicrobium glaciale]
MFVIFGTLQITTSFGPVEQNQYQNYNNTEFWQLNRLSKFFTLFFIPIFPYNTIYWYYCPICNYGIELDSVGFKSYKSIAEINSSFIENKISEEEKNIQMQKIHNALQKNAETERSKHLEASKEWVETVSKKNDAELIEILSSKSSGYNPAFIIAAEEKYKKRNLLLLESKTMPIKMILK